MSEKLDYGKTIYLTKHLVERWAERILEDESVSVVEKADIIKELRNTLISRRYTLIKDGKEYNGTKYRFICTFFSEIMTFIIIDTKLSLVFKTMWKSKKYEEELLKNEMSHM